MKVITISAKAQCVDCDTEFFNGYEWKKIKDYNVDDMVLQYNENGTANLVKPLEYIVNEDSILYSFATPKLNMCLSADHECYYITDKHNLTHKPFYKIMESHINAKSSGFGGRFITSFNYGGKGIDLSNDEIRLMCAVIADSALIECENKCYLNLKKERKINELRSILKKLNIDYKEFRFKSMPGYIRFKFTPPRMEKYFSKYWYDCNQEQLKIICDNVYKWDGFITKNGSVAISTCNIDTANFIQFAYSACGYRANILTTDRRGTLRGGKYERKSIEYCVSASKNTLVQIANRHTDRSKFFKEYATKDGLSYCFTVPSRMLVLRRNNKIFITGNCGKDHTANLLKNKLEQDGSKVLITHFADLLKYIVTNFFDWDGQKDEAGRTKLQYVGTDVIRTQRPDYWVDFIAGILEMFPDEWDYVIIPDTRFPNENDIFKKKGFDITTVRVIRPDFDNGLTEEQKSHASETALDNYKFDCWLINNGDETINDEVDKLIDYINLGGNM